MRMRYVVEFEAIDADDSVGAAYAATAWRDIITRALTPILEKAGDIRTLRVTGGRAPKEKEIGKLQAMGDDYLKGIMRKGETNG